jgi:uncharacterized damage-inducible protein DinB
VSVSRAAIDELLYLLDEAMHGPGIVESNESQALIPNLATVDEATWRKVPAGGSRSIESIVLHVGACKVMYADYAFGPGTLFWDQPAVQPWADGQAPMAETIEWLERVHRALVEHIAALDDSELRSPRLTNWGEQRETRWIVSTLLQHDLYHAGEINHIRSLFSGDDSWLFQRDTAETANAG